MAKISKGEYYYKYNLEVANEIHESLKEREENLILCIRGLFRIMLLRDFHLLILSKSLSTQPLRSSKKILCNDIG